MRPSADRLHQFYNPNSISANHMTSTVIGRIPFSLKTVEVRWRGSREAVKRTDLKTRLDEKKFIF